MAVFVNYQLITLCAEFVNSTHWLSSIIVMLLVGICESSGWFMKPAAVHDYRFQNASTLFGWFPANIEYFKLMLKKVSQYSNEKASPSTFQTLFHSSLGIAIAVAHLFVLTLFGCFVWYGYYVKNKRLGGIAS
jgi:ABC-type phosphate/phosphonate transport system permease subunit